jgi:glutathione S-transferase
VYTLYYSPGTASMAVHLALLEIGAPHRLERVDFSRDSQQGAEYLRLNPRGQVPTLLIDGKPYFESAALLMILAERHPEARLAPPPGSPLRADWYQWIAFFTNALGSAFRCWFYPPDLGSDEHPPFVREALRRKIEEAWTLVDAHLAQARDRVAGAEDVRRPDACTAKLEAHVRDRGTDGVGGVADSSESVTRTMVPVVQSDQDTSRLEEHDQAKDGNP